MTNDSTVVRSKSQIVQGNDSMISSQTVFGNLLSDTPKSNRATLDI